MPVFSRGWLPPGQQPTRWADADRLRVSGPALQVTISIPSALAAQLQQVQTPVALPAPQTGLALIDTGASVTSVDDATFQALGLSPTGTISVATPSGTAVQPIYDCEISFPGTPIPTVPGKGVAGAQLAGLGYMALIGRDVLKSFQLVYNGVEGIWTLSF